MQLKMLVSENRRPQSNGDSVNGNLVNSKPVFQDGQSTGAGTPWTNRALLAERLPRPKPFVMSDVQDIVGVTSFR